MQGRLCKGLCRRRTAQRLDATPWAPTLQRKQRLARLLELCSMTMGGWLLPRRTMLSWAATGIVSRVQRTADRPLAEQVGAWEATAKNAKCRFLRCTMHFVQSLAVMRIG